MADALSSETRGVEQPQPLDVAIRIDALSTLTATGLYCFVTSLPGADDIGRQPGALGHNADRVAGDNLVGLRVSHDAIIVDCSTNVKLELRHSLDKRPIGGILLGRSLDSDYNIVSRRPIECER